MPGKKLIETVLHPQEADEIKAIQEQVGGWGDASCWWICYIYIYNILYILQLHNYFTCT